MHTYLIRDFRVILEKFAEFNSRMIGVIWRSFADSSYHTNKNRHLMVYMLRSFLRTSLRERTYNNQSYFIYPSFS